MKTAILFALVIVLLGWSQASQAQPSSSAFETLSVVRALGEIDLPPGTVLWRSSVSNWTGAVLGAQTDYKGAVLDVGTLLVFDEASKLRVIHSRMIRGNSTWRVFDATGAEVIPEPLLGPLPRERQFFISPSEMDIVPMALAAEIHAKTRLLSRPPNGWPIQLANVDAAVGVGAGFTAEPIQIPADTFVETARLSDDGRHWASEFVLLNDATIRGLVLPKGSVIRFAVVGMPDQPFVGLVSRSPTSLPVFEASAVAGGVISWSGNLAPQTYVLATPVTVGSASLPPGTWVSRSESDAAMKVRPPTRITINGVPIDSHSFSHIRNGQIIDTWLAADWEYAPNRLLSAGTHVLLKNGQLEIAALQQPRIIDRLPLVNIVVFYPDGKVRAGTLNAPASLGGIDCGAGGFRLHPSGDLEQCKLAHAQTVKGIKLRADDVIITAAGNVIAGILDQDLQIGINTLHPGDRLGFVAEERTTLEVLDGSGVNDLEAEIRAMVDDAVPKALLAMKNQVNVLGSFGADDINLESATRVRQEHGILFPRRYSVRNFLKNPPFADCDCRIELVPEFGWKVDQQLRFTIKEGWSHDVIVFTRIRPGSLIKIETNFCPTTFFALLLNRFASIFGPQVQSREQEVTRKKFTDKVVTGFSTILSLLNPDVQIVPSETRIEDIQLVDGAIRVTARYSKVIR